MPALTNASVPNATRPLDASAGFGIDVVCAWPLSSQYGTGSRVLYYVLVAACVFALKAEWLRNACVGLALLLPVVAALHGIVLAAMHVDGAVDLDIYGAFQMCAIGVLAALVAVRQSRTYFNAPGRNIIFVWAGLILAGIGTSMQIVESLLIAIKGLLSLTVEFYRSATTLCLWDPEGKPILSANDFPYLENFTCNMQCDAMNGPFSVIRGGTANNIYVIPAPERLTFNTALLLCAACCIPAILLLVSMWFRILQVNWKRVAREGRREIRSREPGALEDDNSDEPELRGGNVTSEPERTSAERSHEDIDSESPDALHDGDSREQSTKKEMNKVARAVRRYGEVVIFGAAVVAILIVGERNLFSRPIRYQQEPLGNIGQWSPIAGTGLAILGSLYLLLAEAMIQESLSHGEDEEDVGITRRIAKVLIKFNRNFLQLAQNFDDKEFREGDATHYPEIPGEDLRNRHLSRTRSNYSPSLRAISSGSSISGFSDHTSHPAENSVAASPPFSPSPAKRKDTLEVPRPSDLLTSPLTHPNSLSLSRCASAEEDRSSRPRSPGTPTIVVSPEPASTAIPRSRSRRHTVESSVGYARAGAVKGEGC